MDALDVRGDASLGPQYLNGVEAVLDVFPLRHLNLHAAAYYNRYSDVLAYVMDGGQLVPTSLDAEAYGGELMARAAGRIGGVRLEGLGGVSYQRLLTEEELVGGDVRKAIPDNEAVPELVATARAHVVLDEPGLRLYARVRWVSERVPSQSNLLLEGTTDMRYPGYRLSAYSLLDLALSTRPIDLGGADLGFLLKVTNVLGARYAEPGFNGVDIPGMPRSIWVQVASRF